MTRLTLESEWLSRTAIISLLRTHITLAFEDEAAERKVQKRYRTSPVLLVYLNISAYGIRQRRRNRSSPRLKPSMSPRSSIWRALKKKGLLRTLFRRLERDKAANDGTYDGGPKLRYVDDFV